MQGSGPDGSCPGTCGGKSGTLSDELFLAPHSSEVPTQMPPEVPSRMPSEMPSHVPMGQISGSPSSHTAKGQLFGQAQPHLQHSLQAFDVQQPAFEAKASREGDTAETHSQEGLTGNASRDVDQCQVTAKHNPPPPPSSSQDDGYMLFSCWMWSPVFYKTLCDMPCIGSGHRAAWVDNQLLFKCSVY